MAYKLVYKFSKLRFKLFIKINLCMLLRLIENVSTEPVFTTHPAIKGVNILANSNSCNLKKLINQHIFNEINKDN